ncbi:MAG: hypothetical protein ACJA2S_000395 [Cyclobacteriaceae bacterium]|jgi:hypothetical protein
MKLGKIELTKSISTIPILFVLTCFLSIQNQILAQADQPAVQKKAEAKIKFMAAAQFWGRYTDLNPGTTIQGTPQSYVTDIAIRRFRVMASGNINERWFVKFQLGANNLNYLNRNTQIKILDVEAFYKVNNWLQLGGGKTGYVGLSRYAAPATSSALAHDIPIFNLPTVNISDDLIRRMSLVGKGQLGKLDYRVILSRPVIPTSTKALTQYAEFERRTPNYQKSAYLKYQVFDKESQNSAFTAATYFGKKKVMNIGAGFLQQNTATWQKIASGDTLRHNLLLFATDFFLDLPLNLENSKSITFYTSYFNYDFGPSYLRNIGVNNAADGVQNGSFNGKGNSFPAVGTGFIWYSQLAYRFQLRNFIKGIKSFQPYFTIQNADYERLNENMIMLDYGINIIMNGHDSKLTIGIQDRPIFDYDSNNNLTTAQRKFMGVVQYQVKIR